MRVFSKHSQCSVSYGWIRIFGYGIYWVNIKTEDLNFSDRNRFGRHIVVFGYLFRYLPKNRQVREG